MTTTRAFFLFIFYFLQLGFLSAQLPEHCGTDRLLQDALRDPASAKRLQQNQQRVWQYIQTPKSRSAGDTIIVIPVVVHVIHSGEKLDSGANISDAQILSEIAVLNKCFNKENADTVLIPNWFKSRAASVGLKFCLADTDTAGNFSTGITRDSFPVMSQNTFDNTVKPATQWDPTKYLNIWTVKFGGGGGGGDVLGYSNMPGLGIDNKDGIVINYLYFGARPGLPPNPLNVKDTIGKTTVHEVGHWLGLYHIFYGACAGMTPESCDTAGDYICDTPPELEPTYGNSNNLVQNTCNETPNDEYDMWMNYMDYVDDNELIMFTTDQAAEMRGVLNTMRLSIQYSHAADSCKPIPIVITEVKDYNDVEASVYPNPANENVNLHYSITEKTEVNVVDMLGQTVLITELAAGKNSVAVLNLNKQPAGVFLVFLQSAHSQKTLKLTLVR